MPNLRTTTQIALLAMAVGVSGCSIFRGTAQLVRITPLTPHSTLPAADSYYEAARSAIDRRDYATALELLQAARARNDHDIRVLNAFGVVYDKLGRFDLSARYYAQAKAIDAQSPIVNANLAYSDLLQHKLATQGNQPSPSDVAVSDRAPPASLQMQPRRPGVIYLSAIAPGVIVAPAARLQGRPLEVINASGHTDGAEPVRVALARLGWTVPKKGPTVAPMQARTIIQYPKPAQPLAAALARTLPARTATAVCTDNCRGVRIVVGADSTTWKFARTPANASKG